jgi:hypothetical protein
MKPLVALAFVLAGCTGPLTSTVVGGLDVDVYRANVHPFVRFSCASLDCHGAVGRPLRLYAEDGLRAHADLRGVPLSDAEAAWNVAAFAGIDPSPRSIEAHGALGKPVAGELWHGGGDVWASRDDAGYRCLRAWLARESPTSAVADACADARLAVDPYPADAGPLDARP